MQNLQKRFLRRLRTSVIFWSTVFCSFGLICLSVVIENWVYLETVNMHQSNEHSGVVGCLERYACVRILKLILGCARDVVADSLEFELGFYFKEIMIDELFKSELYTVTGGTLDEFMKPLEIVKKAQAKYYVYLVVHVPASLVDFLCVLYQMLYVKRYYLNRVVLAGFASMLVVYFSFFFYFIRLRKRLRVGVNQSQVTMLACAERILPYFDMIKACGLENVNGQYFFRAARTFYRAECHYLLASELLRLLMRLSFVFARMGALSALYLQVQSVDLKDVYVLFVGLPILGSCILNVRNTLAMFFEYMAESKFLNLKAPAKNNCRGINKINTLDSRIGTSRRAAIHDMRSKARQNRLKSGYRRDGPADITASSCFDGGVRLSDLEIYVNGDVAYASNPQCDTPVVTINLLAGRNRTVGIKDIVFPGKLTSYVISYDSEQVDIMAESLLGFRAYMGSIFFAQTDAADIDQPVRLRNISYMPSRHECFDRSVIYNIAFGSGLSESAAISRLAELGLDGPCEKFIKGISTEAGINGCRLSNGQLQMVCLSRALIRDCPIYILNNPFNQLDKYHRSVVMDAISRLRGRTIIAFGPEYDEQNKFDHQLQLHH